MADQKAVILRAGSNNDDKMELFVGDANENILFFLDLDKQLAWLVLIADNIRNSRKRHA